MKNAKIAKNPNETFLEIFKHCATVLKETPCLALLPDNCDIQGPFFHESKKSESTAKRTGQRFGNTCDEALGKQV